LPFDDTEATMPLRGAAVGSERSAMLLAALPRSFAAASGLQLKPKALLYSRALFFPS